MLSDLTAEAVPPPPIATGPFTPRQNEILDDLERIIVREGFADLTVAVLAQRLRCSRRTLYELADTKDDLVLLVLDRLLRRMGTRAHDRLRKLDDPAERLRSFMAAAIAEIRTVSITFAEDIQRHTAARRLFEAHYAFACSVLASVIQDGIDRGLFRKVHAQLVAQIFDAGIARLQRPDVLRTLALSEADAFTELTSILLHGITA